MKRKTILVTGASGFIGANLVRKLIEERYIVHIITRPATDLWRLNEIKHRLNIYKTLYTDKDKIRKIVAKVAPVYIYHLAAYGNNHTQSDLYKMIDVNIISLVHLLTAAKQIPYELFVCLGSSSEYGFKSKPMRENDLLEPASFYAATKAGATHICSVFARLYSKPIVVIRPFSVYGPYEEKSRLIPAVILSSLKNRAIPVTTGHEMRDFIYIKDLTDALLKINKLKKLSGKAINIGSGKQYSTREIVMTIHKLMQSKSIINWGAYPSHSWDTSFWQADTALAKEILDWKTRYSLKKGLSETIGWFKKHEDYYDK